MCVCVCVYTGVSCESVSVHQEEHARVQCDASVPTKKNAPLGYMAHGFRAIQRAEKATRTENVRPISAKDQAHGFVRT